MTSNLEPSTLLLALAFLTGIVSLLLLWMLWRFLRRWWKYRTYYYMREGHL